MREKLDEKERVLFSQVKPGILPLHEKNLLHLRIMSHQSLDLQALMNKRQVQVLDHVWCSIRGKKRLTYPIRRQQIAEVAGLVAIGRTGFQSVVHVGLAALEVVARIASLHVVLAAVEVVARAAAVVVVGRVTPLHIAKLRTTGPRR